MGGENKWQREEDAGFKLIKKFVELYPNVEYPTVNNDMIEIFCKGARKMGIYHTVLSTDEGHCPTCKISVGKIGKNALLLHTLAGVDSTLCIYCSYEGTIQDLSGEVEFDTWDTHREHVYYQKAICKAEGWKYGKKG